MSTDLGGYRFQDDDIEPMRGSDSPVVCSVEFYPSLDDHVRFSAKENERQQHLTSWSRFSVQAFVLVNMIVCPALLLFYGNLIVGLVVFATNLFFGWFFISAIARIDYRRYLRSLYGDDYFEKEIVRIELTEDGVFARHQGDVSFFNWRSITRIEEEETSYIFYLRVGGILVRKTGFVSSELKSSFVDFARSHLNESRRPELKS